MKVTLYRIFLILLVVTSLTFITYNSLQNATKSQAVSNGISQGIVEIVVPNYGNLPEEEKEETVKKFAVTLRDVAHFMEFAVLAFFLALFFYTVRFNYGRYTVAIAIVILFCFAYAIFDEWMQTFVDGRGTQWQDIWFDSLGAIVGVIGAMFVDWIGVKITYFRKLKKTT